MPEQNVSRLIDTAALEKAIEAFARPRGWEQFHSPKNLAMALTGCPHQRRQTIDVGRIHQSASAQQQIHHLVMAHARRIHQGRFVQTIFFL